MQNMGEIDQDSKISILVVDDDKKLCSLITEYLESMNYRVDCAYNGPDGLTAALSGKYQVVILDVMLPGMDGFEVLRKIRAESQIPVLMLTSRGDETDRIVGLEIGADDYLPKTFSTRELLARLRAVTRRSYNYKTEQKEDFESPIEIGDIRVDPSSHSVYRAGNLLELTPIEYSLLACLLRSAGRILSRDQLLDYIAGRDYEVFDRSIDMHISTLRKKLGDDPKAPVYIKTVRAAGYMFIKDDGHKR
jgi:two-component system, OmpR family, response regulator CpxR